MLMQNFKEEIFGTKEEGSRSPSPSPYTSIMGSVDSAVNTPLTGGVCDAHGQHTQQVLHTQQAQHEGSSQAQQAGSSQAQHAQQQQAGSRTSGEKVGGRGGDKVRPLWPVACTEVVCGTVLCYLLCYLLLYMVVIAAIS